LTRLPERGGIASLRALAAPEEHVTRKISSVTVEFDGGQAVLAHVNGFPYLLRVAHGADKDHYLNEAEKHLARPLKFGVVATPHLAENDESGAEVWPAGIVYDIYPQ
jgi:hypothetical protein